MKLPFLSFLKMLTLVMALTLVGHAFADEKGPIRGSVVTLGLDGEPVRVPAAQVVIRCETSPGKSWMAITNEEGRFVLFGPPDGMCSATASARGFRSQAKHVRVTGETTTDLSFQLQMLPVVERTE